MYLPRILMVSSLLVLVAGCSSSPVPISRFFDPGQETLGGALHWKILADDTTRRIVGCLEGSTFWDRQTESYQPYCRQDTSGLGNRPLFVEQVEPRMPFSRAFHDYLITALVQRGRAIVLDSADALVVRYRVQFVKRDKRVPLNPVPGPYALIGGGVWALDNLTLAKLLTLGTLTDAYVSATQFGGSQVIITTSLMDGERFVMRRTGGYFIPETDVGQYVGTGSPPGLLPPRRTGTPPGVRTFDVVAE